MNMVNHFFVEPRALKRLRTGPLSEHIDGFAQCLWERGYADQSGKIQLRLISELSRWLLRRDIETKNLNEQIISKFLQYKKRHGRVHRGYASCLQAFLLYLRDIGLITPAASETLKGQLHPILGTFEKYLLEERGLSQATLLNYMGFVKSFLSERFGVKPVKLQVLNARDVTGFVCRHAKRLGLGRAKLMVTALRSFLRFLRLRSEIDNDLAGAVPSVATWKLSTLPKFIKSEEVNLILKHCDQMTNMGQRDFAILLLLARLGLRAGEVVAMTLDDINWDKGELKVRGKGSRQEMLPLPEDVGEALAKYLQDVRPLCSSRRVFIRTKAPLRGFASSVAVCTIVRRAIERAGLHPAHKGAHLLRHSLATFMLKKGASLAEVGEVLRHKTATSTEIYAKVDIEALRALTQPWIGGEA
jgi:site-specific recombinase XerD